MQGGSQCVVDRFGFWEAPFVSGANPKTSRAKDDNMRVKETLTGANRPALSGR